MLRRRLGKIPLTTLRKGLHAAPAADTALPSKVSFAKGGQSYAGLQPKMAVYLKAGVVTPAYGPVIWTG